MLNSMGVKIVRNRNQIEFQREIHNVLGILPKATISTRLFVVRLPTLGRTATSFVLIPTDD